LDLKERKSTSEKLRSSKNKKKIQFRFVLAPGIVEEGGAMVTPILQSAILKINDQSN
jgi:hypothetical protein